MQYLIVPVTPLEQNCTLFWCEQTNAAVIIDPGGDVGRIVKAVEAKNLKPSHVLITHGHFDHVGAARETADHFSVPIVGPHEDDLFLLERVLEHSQIYGLPGQSFKPGQWLADGDRIQFGNEELEVLHCPGHTPGHVVYYHRASRLLQVGDVMFQNSIGRTDFPRSNHADLIASIREKLFPLGDDVSFIPGHGPMSTIGYERRYNPFVGDPA
ncbi:MAG: MBL fold metallo-hydrolase [Zoogloeaceae bacterium]|jgi:glyoxylase-like metal-dependent hydrolase (beta-lactamase superfamily II)|nr:MBL fold metallo-hydrolase [Zoogloeaceae bacterium]